MEQTMAESRFEEMGVIVDDNFGSEPKMKVKQCNRKIKIFREFALASLCALTKSKKTSKSSVITACDSFAASGIAGLQWKKHLKSQVHVSLADHNDLSKLTSNVEANSLKATGMTLNSARVPGDPFQQQEEKEVHTYRADARAILSMEAFQFIYVNPNKSCAEYIDSAFHSVSHGGVVCFVMSDVSSFGRQPHIVRRQHAARVIKTEYWKEIAARIMLGSMAIAAARCNKGIVPMYVVSVEDYLLVGVKVGRGHVRSEAALNEVVPLLHCRFCEERVFMEIQLAPEENPYSKLPCKCKQSHLGKTAVMIGPMWRGAIFNHEFLCEIQECGTELKLSNNFADVVKSLIAESFGSDDKKQQPHTIGTSGQMEQDCEGTDEIHQSTNNTNQSNQSLPTKEGDPSVSLFSVSVTESGALVAESLSSADQTESLKRKSTEDNDSGGDAKKIKKDGISAKEKKQMLRCQSLNVPFYYNINKIKAINLPKIDKVISIIQNKGFKASRTHFDHSAIRTSASVEQLLDSLRIKMPKQYSKDDIPQALKEVREGLSLRKTAAKFNIPCSTLCGYMKRGTDIVGVHAGRKVSVPHDVEKKCVDEIIQVAQSGFPMTKDQVLTMIGNVCNELQISTMFKNGKPGDKYWRCLKQRFPQISANKTTVRDRLHETEFHILVTNS